MKKTKLLMPLTSVLGIGVIVTPLISLTSCNRPETKINPTIKYKYRQHFKEEVAVSEIKLEKDFTITFELVDYSFLDKENSKIKIGGWEREVYIKFSETDKIEVKQEGSKFSCKVKGEFVKDANIVIYFSTYRKWTVDTSESGSEFTFYDVKEEFEFDNYLLVFQTAEHKIFDPATSVIKSGDDVITTVDYKYGEKLIGNVAYDYILIPAYKTDKPLKFILKSTDAWEITQTTYPEYETDLGKKIKKGTDLECNFTIYNPSEWILDELNTVIKVGGSALSTADYTLDVDKRKLTISKDKITDDLEIDVPVVKCFTLWSHKFGEGSTILIKEPSKKIINNREYTFKIKAIDSQKTIQWDKADTYLTIDNVDYVKGNGWDYNSTPDADGYYTVTVDSAHTTADIICHFVTQ